MWRTLFYLLGVMLFAGAIGTAIGWLKSPETAALFALLLAQTAGIAASIEKIIRAKKSGTVKTWKP